jgi:hypothetical protein
MNFLQAFHKTFKKTTKEITNIRYGKLGEIKFDFRGKTETLKEPEDVILVGSKNILAQMYIARKLISGKTSVNVDKLKKVI